MATELRSSISPRIPGVREGGIAPRAVHYAHHVCYVMQYVSVVTAIPKGVFLEHAESLLTTVPSWRAPA